MMSTDKTDQGRKRALSSGESDDASQDRMSQSSVGSNIDYSPMVTPTKRQKKFKFWTSPEDEADSHDDQEPIQMDFGSQKGFNISDLSAGRQTGKVLEFRVSLTSSPKGSEKCQVFKMHGIDNSGEICFVAYRDVAKICQEFFELNKLYSVENFNVKYEEERYRSGSGHACQVVIEDYTKLEEVQDNESIREIPFQFVDMNDLEKMEVKSVVDVIGIVVKDCGITKTHNDIPFRELFMTDETVMSTIETVPVTLWRNVATEFTGGYSDVVALRKAKTAKSTDGDLVLNVNPNALVWVNPTVKKAPLLVNWFAEAVKNKKKDD